MPKEEVKLDMTLLQEDEYSITYVDNQTKEIVKKISFKENHEHIVREIVLNEMLSKLSTKFLKVNKV